MTIYFLHSHQHTKYQWQIFFFFLFEMQMQWIDLLMAKQIYLFCIHTLTVWRGSISQSRIVRTNDTRRKIITFFNILAELKPSYTILTHTHTPKHSSMHAYAIHTTVRPLERGRWIDSWHRHEQMRKNTSSYRRFFHSPSLLLAALNAFCGCVFRFLISIAAAAAFISSLLRSYNGIS